MPNKFLKIFRAFSLQQKLLIVTLFIICVSVLLPAMFLGAFYKKTPPIKKVVAGIQTILTPTIQPIDTATPSLSIAITGSLKKNTTNKLTPTPTIKATATNTPTPQQNTTTSNQTTTASTVLAAAIQASPTLIPGQPTVIAQIVHVQITEPDGTTNFQVIVKDGDDICAVLQTAKSEGKIQSLTLDNSYMDTLHSVYVKEMNGFSNNWTFTTNGTSPLGCSLAHPKPNDQIIWKFN